MEHLKVHLTVNEPFTDNSGKSYVRGDHIRDPERIADVLKNFHHHVVQRVAHDVHVDGSFYGDPPAEPTEE